MAVESRGSEQREDEEEEKPSPQPDPLGTAPARGASGASFRGAAWLVRVLWAKKKDVKNDR